MADAPRFEDLKVGQFAMISVRPGYAKTAEIVDLFNPPAGPMVAVRPRPPLRRPDHHSATFVRFVGTEAAARAAEARYLAVWDARRPEVAAAEAKIAKAQQGLAEKLAGIDHEARTAALNPGA